jgi:hypothetical protein
MIVLKIKKGKWKNGNIKRDLIYEVCPTKSCDDTELHYPDYISGPHCPDCKKGLIGSGLIKFAGRVSYHLGA